eukprot:6619325-Lingulodinium_polyedra.AAC.1
MLATRSAATCGTRWSAMPPRCASSPPPGLHRARPRLSDHVAPPLLRPPPVRRPLPPRVRVLSALCCPASRSS